MKIKQIDIPDLPNVLRVDKDVRRVVLFFYIYLQSLQPPVMMVAPAPSFCKVDLAPRINANCRADDFCRNRKVLRLWRK